MGKTTVLISTYFSAFTLSGCAVYMASTQPDAKNVDLFKVERLGPCF